MYSLGLIQLLLFISYLYYTYIYGSHFIRNFISICYYVQLGQ